VASLAQAAPQTGISDDRPSWAPPASAVGVSAILKFNERQLVFSASSGTELDAYQDPDRKFVQRCILCTDPALPGFRAYYRPDANGNREEWVFEYGDPWAATIGNLGAYTTVITRADGSTQTVSVPEHFWYSRWRWQSAPRPVRRTVADLTAANLIPHFDPSGLSSGSLARIPTYTPMAYCGLPPDEGVTGDYPGIGIITGWQAQYLTRERAESLWRNHAEASGTMQWHVRDPKTGAPFSLVTYANATMYAASEGSPYFAGTKKNRPDSGHLPSLSYVPFLLTGDPYHLEELQFVANAMLLSATPKYRLSDNGRYCAWPLRAIGQTVVAMPDSVPSWMLPRSYFEGWLTKFRDYLHVRVANTTDPWCYVFHAMPDYGQATLRDPGKSGDHVWQHAMISLVVGWLVSAGRSEWRPIAEWSIRSEVDRASATSGYMRSHPSPYHIRMRNASVLASAMSASDKSLVLQYPDTFAPGETVTIDAETLTLGTSGDGLTWSIAARPTPSAHAVNNAVYGRKFTSWTELMASNRLTNPSKWVAPSGDTLAEPVNDLTYPGYHRAALAQAMRAGLSVPGLAESFAWLDAQVRANTRAHPIRENWSVV